MPISTLKQLLEQYSQLYRNNRPNCQHKYASFYELVLDCGQEMSPAITEIDSMGIPKNCYYNCQTIAFEEKDLIYCEGFALCEEIDFPLPHAWLLNSKGIVIEATLEEPAQHYIGVAFCRSFIKSIIKQRKKTKNGDYLSLFECNHLENYSFLKQGLPSKAYALSMNKRNK